MMSSTTILLAGMAVLTVDSAIELSFVSNMVHWLHAYAGKQWEVAYGGGSFSLHGKPEHLLVDQGHISNAAAGTALVAVCLCGFPILWLRQRQLRQRGTTQGFVHFLYSVWLAFTIIAPLMAFIALVYTMTVTYQHAGQVIIPSVAASLNNHPYPNYHAYPVDSWTPQNWFTAVLQLPLLDDSVHNEIHFQLTLMHGWQWNLIPLLIIDLVVVALAFWDRSAKTHAAKLIPQMEKYDS